MTAGGEGYRVELVRANITPEERRRRLALAYDLILSWNGDDDDEGADDVPACEQRPAEGKRGRVDLQRQLYTTGDGGAAVDLA